MSEPTQWAQVTQLNNSNETCDYIDCERKAISEYVPEDGSVFYYCNSH